MEMKNIKTAIKNDATMYAVVEDRIFQAQPIETPIGAYITFSLVNRERRTIEDNSVVRFVCFSKDLAEREAMGNALISLFEGKNNELGYKAVMQSQSDVDAKLDTDFYATIIFFRFYGIKS